MKELRAKIGTSILLSTHDLGVIKHIPDRVAVMYLGRIVELAEKNELFFRPLHHHTQALLFSVHIPDPEVKRDRLILKGEVPSPINPPSGCSIHRRCRCAKEMSA